MQKNVKKIDDILVKLEKENSNKKVEPPSKEIVSH